MKFYMVIYFFMSLNTLSNALNLELNKPYIKVAFVQSIDFCFSLFGEYNCFAGEVMSLAGLMQDQSEYTQISHS